MKRKIAIRATVGAAVCVLVGEMVVGGIFSEKQAIEVEDVPEVIEAEEVTEPEVEEEVFECIGLTDVDVEVNCILEKLHEWKIQCCESDIEQVACLGYVTRFETETGVSEPNYNLVEYGVTLKDRRWGGVVCVSVERLRECGVSNEDEWLRIWESRRP